MFCFTRESLYEDEEFDQRPLAALLVSKVGYVPLFCCYIIAAKLGVKLLCLSNILKKDCFLMYV